MGGKFASIDILADRANQGTRFALPAKPGMFSNCWQGAEKPKIVKAPQDETWQVLLANIYPAGLCNLYGLGKPTWS
ncbi:hypothetical protein DTL42_03180 [Bremerella cremea]|uniref:Uncharacterized protein n=1 Tax=Bremerella cremea TaxID=1031537 RepID=A0A368KV37_9BACT|nr:hypothetical protein DTL42_03180 [Bremerella cremea]